MLLHIFFEPKYPPTLRETGAFEHGVCLADSAPHSENLDPLTAAAAAARREKKHEEGPPGMG